MYAYPCDCCNAKDRSATTVGTSKLHRVRCSASTVTSSDDPSASNKDTSTSVATRCCPIGSLQRGFCNAASVLLYDLFFVIMYVILPAMGSLQCPRWSLQRYSRWVRPVPKALRAEVAQSSQELVSDGVRTFLAFLQLNCYQMDQSHIMEIAKQLIKRSKKTTHTIAHIVLQTVPSDIEHKN